MADMNEKDEQGVLGILILFALMFYAGVALGALLTW